MFSVNKVLMKTYIQRRLFKICSWNVVYGKYFVLGSFSAAIVDTGKNIGAMPSAA